MKNVLRQVADVLKPDTIFQVGGIVSGAIGSGTFYLLSKTLPSTPVEILAFSSFYWWGTYRKVIRTRSAETKRRLFTNSYARRVIDHLVKELYDACVSSGAEEVDCAGGNKMLVYKKFGPASALLVAPRSLEQYENVCKNKCFICLEDVYDPIMMARAAVSIGIYKLAHRTKKQLHLRHFRCI